MGIQQVVAHAPQLGFQEYLTQIASIIVEASQIVTFLLRGQDFLRAYLIDQVFSFQID
jgi:hypothetical protein